MDDGIQRLKAINAQTSAQELETAKHHDLVLSNIQTQEVILRSFQTLVNYLENSTTKTEVINQLKEIGTPDALQVVQAVDSLHETLKTHENTDLSELTKLMSQLLIEAQQIPKKLPEEKEQRFVDYTKQFQGLQNAVKAIEQVVKAQKLIAEAPIVNVPKPHINVEAPNLVPLQQGFRDVVKAVQAIVIPEYKTDNKEVEKLLKKANKTLEGILDKPVGHGGGGGRVSPYEDAAHQPSFVTLNNGAVPVADQAFATKIDEVSATLSYIGKAIPGSVVSASVWQVKKLDTTSGLDITFADGDSLFNNVWANRALLTYS